ncbi:hypothetical protein [Thalassobellus citreus]|uniref:hypothetical protein n=1 Tax=Thalassobellus citreus TaxID=3367752 RepID=UPI00379F0C6B
MKIFCNTKVSFVLVFAIFLSTILISCSKDSELVLDEEELILTEDNQNEDNYSFEVVDDSFFIKSGSIEVLDVLKNDAILSATNLKLNLVNNPIYGEVQIKEDNTIEYVAPYTLTEITETLIYTVVVIENDSEIFSGTGNVTIQCGADISSENYLFTAKAKSVLKQRFENGYIAGVGFEDEISRVIDKASEFLLNPSGDRPVFGESSSISNGGHYLHTTAVYAYAIDDQTLANSVASELLEIVNSNDLYTSYWNNSHTLRWDSAPEALWIQSSKAKKMKDSYNFIKKIQTVLSSTDKTSIEEWFERFAELSFNSISTRIDLFFGGGWSVNNLTGKYYTGAEYGRPLQDAQGNDIYVMAQPQDIYNNRNFDIIAWIHSWAVEAGDLSKETYCRDFFKMFFKYGVFPDGTIWELKRNNNTVPYQGLMYGDTTLESAIHMAHKDAMGGHFVGDLLYDYTTTDGVLNGSTTISSTPYEGSSTTDGETKKGLLLFMKAQSNYLRTQANGGWNDIRFYVDDDDNYHPLDATGKLMSSSHIAMANLYYKDKDLEDWYRYSSSAGYPLKQTIYKGYNGGAWNEDSGAWGNMIFGSMWFGQENNFF